MSQPACYRVLVELPEVVVIKDIGPWEVCLTVTNDAENVCTHLWNMHGTGPRTRFYYLDSMGEWGEMIHDRGEFALFRPADEEEITRHIDKALHNMREDLRIERISRRLNALQNPEKKGKTA